jgi:hypothetical protein
MMHFGEACWIDFIRGIAESSVNRAIQQHLDNSCPECKRNWETWRRVMQGTKKVRDLGPPEDALRAVKAGFGLSKVVAFPSGKLDLAVLTFDSERQAVVAGVRSGSASARQFLYKSGSLCIDMRMQQTPGSESILLIGQLLDSLNPGHGIGGVPVSLLSQGDTISRKKTNAVGEFDFGVEPRLELQLVFRIGDSRAIVVSVPNVASRRVM